MPIIYSEQSQRQHQSHSSNTLTRRHRSSPSMDFSHPPPLYTSSSAPVYDYPPPIISPPRFPSYTASIHHTPSTSSLPDHANQNPSYSDISLSTPVNSTARNYSQRHSSSSSSSSTPIHPHRYSSSSSSPSTPFNSGYNDEFNPNRSSGPTTTTTRSSRTSSTSSTYSTSSIEEEQVAYNLCQMSLALSQQRKDERAGKRTRHIDPVVLVDGQERIRRERDALEKMSQLHLERQRSIAFREWERKCRSERVRRSWG
ncbi:hypothetical protein BCR39DRAFT_228425 [Naematelia encephala]|uniref:Uncharacterized protein n=1 Tax=Naematelia encephala TaxID=71784 RepID=A0A1Y2AYG1_9TREE|nr:hypothetical protein BCR39DRAFT_228425 [Naematelia encephala]